MARSERTTASRSVPSGRAETRPDAAADADIEDLVLRATEAHAASMRGDLNRYRSLITTTHDFTLMAPFGGKPPRAADLSSKPWDFSAHFFRNGRDSTLKVVQAYRSADMVVIAAVDARMSKSEASREDWALRVAVAFRKEKDQSAIDAAKASVQRRYRSRAMK